MPTDGHVTWVCIGDRLLGNLVNVGDCKTTYSECSSNIMYRYMLKRHLINPSCLVTAVSYAAETHSSLAQKKKAMTSYLVF